MKTAPVSRGGQVSIPATIRRRWGTRRVMLIDRGDELVLRPVPDDSIAAAAGSLVAYRTPGTSEIRAQLREEEQAEEARRYGPRP